MRTVVNLLVCLAACAGLATAQDETFAAYVDSDVCARLMLGPITEERVTCSQDTAKEGSEPVLVRLTDNAVLVVNKHKIVKPYIGQFVQATGETKSKTGRIKLVSVEPVPKTELVESMPGNPLLDVRDFRAEAGLYNQVRRQLAMMPYITEYDFIAFSMMGSDVILSGWTRRPNNRSEAYRRVKDIEGIGDITNNISVLPLSSSDRRIAFEARTRIQRLLPRYFWGSGSSIRIIVNRGNIILLGVVDRTGDSDIAYVQCRNIPGSFSVFNLLRVQGSGGE